MTEAKEASFKILNILPSHTSVTFTTDKGIAEAQQADERNYILTTRPLRDWYAWFLAHEGWFPQVVRVVARTYNDNSSVGVLLTILFVVYTNIQFNRFSTFLMSPPTEDAGPASHFLAIAAAVTAGVLGLRYVRKQLSPWARVGELVREAHDTTGTVEVDPARYGVQSGRYNTWRFLLPLLALDQVAEWLKRRFGIPYLFPILLACELILWIDVWVGWHRVPIVREFARLVQRLLYPTPPSADQVRAGQLVLDELAKKVRAGTLSSE